MKYLRINVNYNPSLYTDTLYNDTPVTDYPIDLTSLSIFFSFFS